MKQIIMCDGNQGLTILLSNERSIILLEIDNILLNVVCKSLSKFHPPGLTVEETQSGAPCWELSISKPEV